LPRFVWASAWPELDADRLTTCGHCFVEFALAPQRIAEVAIGLGKVGLDADGFAICCDGLVQFALLIQRRAEVGKVTRLCRVPLYGLTDQPDGDVVPSHLVRDKAK
jgi:hypothetical protein